MIQTFQIGIGVTLVGDTSAGNAAPCATSQVCQYALVQAPTALDAALANTGEVKVAVAQTGTLTYANALLQGQSLMPANYEGILVPCTNTNQLRFASATASTSVKVIAITAIEARGNSMIDQLRR